MAADRPAIPEPTTRTSSSSRSKWRPCTSLTSAGRADRDHPLDRQTGALSGDFVDLYFVDPFPQAIEQPLRGGHFHKTTFGSWRDSFESRLWVGIAQLVQDACLGGHQR